MLMCTPARAAASGANTVCRTAQVATCVLSGATEIYWVVLAQLDVQMLMDRACSRVQCALRSACARIVFRQRGRVREVMFRA